MEAPVPRHRLYINQIGYDCDGSKHALLSAESAANFVIHDSVGNCLLSGRTTEPVYSALCGHKACRIDFTELNQPGRYTLRTQSAVRDFCIGKQPYLETTRALLKGFYYQRASLELLPQFAGIWARPLGHPDTEVLVHASAASTNRSAGTPFASPGGWYDAGDYNKYIVNSGISTFTLLSAYEDWKSVLHPLRVGIPESGGALPDVLAETRWNLEWMLTMQDPADGGVYAKLTNQRFDGMVLPHLCREPRYVVCKTTAAALNFAAALGQASRIYQPFDPDWALRCLTAAQNAYAWAVRHPDVLYKQPADIFTGHYGDQDVTDEFYWAEMTLYVATRDPAWLERARQRTLQYVVPHWQNTGTLGLMECLRFNPDLPERQHFLALADVLYTRLSAEPLGISMQEADFVWGSNGVAANQGLVLLFAYRLTADVRYREAARQLLDYLLGRNPLDYCYVTGLGERPPCYIHHRPSEGDAQDAPVPGLLVGGPNPEQQDAAKCPPYPSSQPALSYLDHVLSCASNEIAINWNAAAVYLSAGLL